ncbi:MAG: hypothetical protein J0H14_07115 [Alphaproteobacteria bacterium]|nr:hypothetical protein [Alphaproteobacteria bacterium]
MSDYGAMWGAQLVANEIFAQGWAANRRHNSNLNQLAADNALLRQEGARLERLYNELAANFNKLRGGTVDLAKDFDRQTAVIAQLRQEKAGLDAEVERLKLSLLKVTGELAILRQIDKERDPEAYRYRDF